MTAKIGSTANQVTISSGTQPVANLPTTCGIAFCKNKLLNGEVTRINQRGFDGNWAPKGNYPPAGTIAQKEATYGYDQWAKADATNMLQVIEAGNFRPSTVHTLSGQNVTTQQITSPASGNWTITVPQTATNVQLEEGETATPFEIRPIAFELAQCQRYYEQFVVGLAGYANAASAQIATFGKFVPKRAVPVTTLVSNAVLINTSSVSFDNVSTIGARFIITATATGIASVYSIYSASAVM